MATKYPSIMLGIHLDKIAGTAARLARLGADFDTVKAALTDMGVTETDDIYAAAVRGFVAGSEVAA